MSLDQTILYWIQNHTVCDLLEGLKHFMIEHGTPPFFIPNLRFSLYPSYHSFF